MVSVLLLSLPEVGVVLGCSPSKVKRLIADGELPAVMVGKVRRVRRVDVDAYLERLAGASFRDRLERKDPA